MERDECKARLGIDWPIQLMMHFKERLHSHRLLAPLTLILLLGMMPTGRLAGQNGFHSLADSILRAYEIPAIGYAIIQSDTILEMEVLGTTKAGSGRLASLQDRFRIGSNTKAITGFIAAQCVQQGKLTWETRFFDLFPELKANARRAYHDLTLLDLLTFRNRFLKWSYGNEDPDPSTIQGDAVAQRLAFARWFLQQAPMKKTKGLTMSNLGFVAAGLMLERASGKSYEDLAREMGKAIGISIGFGPPNATDSLAMWGHGPDGAPEPRAENHRLNWLMAAGNVQLTLPDYSRFIQLQLRGLLGKSGLLPHETFEFLLFGRPQFAVGWFWEENARGERHAHNLGNPGSYLSRVDLNPTADRAVIILANCMTDKGYAGTAWLMERILGSR